VENRNRLRFRPTDLCVRSDAVLLERVLRNLVANACRYTCDGRILVVARRRGGQVRCEVHDTGAGIPVAQQQSIFEEFYQVDNPERDRNRGMGLGLAIVKRNTQLLGHPLQLRSAPGRGSCFALLAPQMAALPASAEVAPEDESRARFVGSSVLLVDDDPIVVSAMVAILALWGCRVLTADSIDSANAVLDDHAVTPQLLIVDYRLRHGVTGGQVIAGIQQRFEKPLPAVIITGDTAPERLREANQAGYPLLHKPVEPRRLRAILEETLLSCAADRSQSAG
jgi:CheY-like chemotaxis protein